MREVIRSNQALLAIGENDGYDVGSDQPTPVGLAQSFSVSLDNNINRVNGLYPDSDHKEHYAYQGAMIAPDVVTQISYHYSPIMVTEQTAGVLKLPSTPPSPFFEEMTGKSNSIYLLVAPEQYGEAYEKFLDQSAPYYSGYSLIALGNNYLTNYSVSWSVGQIPQAQMSFVGSTMNVETITGQYTHNPSISLTGGATGNRVDWGNIQSGASTGIQMNRYGTLETGNIDILPVGEPKDVYWTLEDLNIGGIRLNPSTTAIQSISLQVPINRSNLYGLGNDFPYDRRIQLPSLATLQLEVLATGLFTGNISGLMGSGENNTYDFTVTSEATDDGGLRCLATYFFDDAKLSSQQIGMGLSDNMNVSLSFEIPMSINSGVRIRQLYI